MRKESNFYAAKYLTLFYLIYIVGSIFTDNILLSILLQILVFPFILNKLKLLINEKYNFNSVKIFFNIAIIFLIISTIAPFIGMSFINSKVDPATVRDSIDIKNINNSPIANPIILFTMMITESLLVARGLAFLLLGLWLLKKYKQFNIMVKVAVISLLIFGLHTVFIGIIPFYPPIILVIKYTGISILKYMLPVIQFVLFGSLFFVFEIKKSCGDEYIEE